ncbi:hypothetical protein AC249_AIPGENE24239 [Exaiptasia diaphana]|nr:hypothetical protein AC249_AIPGENE24239 [Exaiptasia diaphana]
MSINLIACLLALCIRRDIYFPEFPEPVLFLPLNKQYGTRDISKSNLTTTAVGLTLSPGPDGKPDGSYYFPGSSSGYIQVPKDPKIDTRKSMSLFTWIYNQGTEEGPLINYESDTNNWNGVHAVIQGSNNPPAFYVAFTTRHNLNDNDGTSMGTPIAKNVWQHVGFTYNFDAAVAKLYIDGVIVQTSAIRKYELNTIFKLKIGGVKYGYVSTKAFKGRLSCFQIYNEALTQKGVLASQRYCTGNEASNTFDATMFLSTSERCLSGHVFHVETDVTDVPTCIGHCLSAGIICKSLNFINEDNSKCQLNNATKAVGFLRVDSKCVYYERV